MTYYEYYRSKVVSKIFKTGAKIVKYIESNKTLSGILYGVSFSKWTAFWWWSYLLQEPADWSYTSNNILINYINVIQCRMRNHPKGCFWYNPGGFEPDYNCKGCYDEI